MALVKTILIYVENDIHILKQLQWLIKKLLLELRLYQVEVITAISSAVANEMMQRDQVALILLEHTAGAKHCLEFVRLISNKPVVILMTKVPNLAEGVAIEAKKYIAEVLERPISRDKLKES